MKLLNIGDQFTGSLDLFHVSMYKPELRTAIYASSTKSNFLFEWWSLCKIIKQSNGLFMTDIGYRREISH